MAETPLISIIDDDCEPRCRNDKLGPGWMDAISRRSLCDPNRHTGKWSVAIYPPDDGAPKEKPVFGTREEAEGTAHSMINGLLKKAIRAENQSALDEQKA